MHLSTPNLSRRTFLRGLGACVALPTLESILPGSKLVAATAGSNLPAAAAGRLATTASGMPLRMAFVAFANGTNYERWTPKGEGRDYELNETFVPMRELKDKFQIISGLHHKTADNYGDGSGDHARSGASFLTGVHAWKTLGAKLKLGVSADQVAAGQVGHLTRFDSLQIGTESSRLYGSCDTGYPCAYQYNISWASETTPLAPEASPRLVFEKLFGSGGKEGLALLKARQDRQKSILDFVLDDVHALNRRLGRNDRQKVDEYLTGVRKLELQIEKSEKFGLPSADIAAPDGIPKDHGEHVDLMYELMALAFQTDSTRIITFPVAPEGSNRTFVNDLGIAEGHHYLTHHSGNLEKRLKVAKIDVWYMQRFAKFVRRLDSMIEPDGTSVLHNSMIVYGCAIGDGNRHNHDELPVVLAGQGGGGLGAGRHWKLDKSTPMTNMYLGMLDRMGVRAQHIGDSSGRLEIA